jgi:hypothetical protein
MNKTSRIVLSFACFTALTAAAFSLARHGNYGWTLFVSLPVIAGALGAWAFQPRTAVDAMRIGSIVGAVGCCLFLLLGAEGFICVLMALPVAIPLAVAGSLLAYGAGSLANAKRPTAMVLLLPVSMFYDGHARPPVYTVTTSIEVNAPPARVWQYVVAFPDITAKPDWVLRTGLAYPIRTRIEGLGVGSARSCELSTGTVQERVTVWNEPRLLQFVVTATPPAMREMGLYGPIYPKHLNGYYISREGQFELTPLPGGRTLVTGTSWYQHGLWPAEYWRWWSDTVIHHIHRRVLEHIRNLSEAG